MWTQIVSVGLSAIILLIIAWVNIGKPLYQRILLRKPFYVRFKLEPRGDGPTAVEMRAPAHSRVQIDFRISPRISHVQNELILRFKGDPTERPMPKSVVNTFFKDGAGGDQDPAANTDHYIDYGDGYHIRNRGAHTKGNTYAIGYSVLTRGPGRFSVQFVAMTEGGEGRSANDLTLIVE